MDRPDEDAFGRRVGQVAQYAEDVEVHAAPGPVCCCVSQAGVIVLRVVAVVVLLHIYAGNRGPCK